MNYKDTLLMPKSKFDMKGNLVTKDPLFINKEISNNIYNNLKFQNQANESFILHDGPPYANGNIHLGHALNKIIKDIIIRQKALKGYNVEWIFGWDTHGLPIEMSVQKDGLINHSTTKSEALEIFKNFAIKQQKKQANDFQKLALFTDYDKKYLTLENEYVAKELEVFFEMYRQNLIYQDLKPVYWSWSSKTALAEAEIEYKKVTSNAIFVEFKIDDNLNALIWTTTPWTLFANTAIAFGENVEYGIYEESISKKKYVIATVLIDSIVQKTQKSLKYLKSFIVKDYLDVNAWNFLTKKESKIVYGHHITTDAGTGIVHIAGGHGEDDYLISKQYNLPLVVVLDEAGLLKNTLQFDGIFYKKAESNIIDYLEQQNAIFYKYEIEHSFPHDWRTKKPIVFMATKQWFVSLDPIKPLLLKNIKEVKWEPLWGENRLSKMIEERNDWCISRQRSWGVPIPIIFDEHNKPINNSQLQSSIVKNISNFGTSWWVNLNLKEFFTSLKLPYHPNYKKETDILDVWFDSGISHYFMYPNQSIDLYVEGNDQYRGWFNSSLITGTILYGRSPYTSVLTHGFTLDKNGNKMSKSIGNVINPLEIINKHGIDILRLWVANSDFKDNLKLSDAIIEQITNDYKKIRNTFRFIHGNIDDFQSNQKIELDLIDEILLSKLNDLLIHFEQKIQLFNFNSAYKELMHELTSGSISFYLDYSKDFLYTYSKNDSKRLAVQYVLKTALDALIYLLTPFIPITTDEIWSLMNDKKECNSPMLYKFDFSFLNNYQQSEKYEELNQIRNWTNREIEILKQNKEVSNSLEISIDIKLNPQSYFFNQKNLLKQVLMVAEVNIFSADEIHISVKKAFDFVKCNRCWKYFSPKKMNSDLCNKCFDVVSLLKNNSQ